MGEELEGEGDFKCKVEERDSLGDKRGRAEAEREGVFEIKRKRKKRGRTDSKVPAARRFLWLSPLHPSHRAGKQKKATPQGASPQPG